MVTEATLGMGAMRSSRGGKGGGSGSDLAAGLSTLEFMWSGPLSRSNHGMLEQLPSVKTSGENFLPQSVTYSSIGQTLLEDL